MNIFKFSFLFIVLLLGVSACTDLEENLIGEVTNDITVDGVTVVDVGGAAPVSSALNAAYGSLRGAGTANHGGYYSVQEITTDEMCIAAKGGDWFDGGILIELHQHTYGPTHAFVNGTWGQQYGAINTVNEAIAGRNGALDANQMAQARALRAYYYLRLMDLYGNVKIITVSGQDAPQSSRAEVFAFVESELLAALGVSEITSSSDFSGSALGTASRTPYEINLYGALGILAKVYLNAEVYSGAARYEEAAAAAGHIIDSGVYELCGAGCSVANLSKRPGVANDPDNLEGYAAVFAANNHEGNSENIWTVEYDAENAGGMNFSQMNLHYSSQFSYNFDAQPWNGYATLEEFYNSYEDGDARKAANFLEGPQLDANGSAVLDFASDDDELQLSYEPSINELAPNSLREAGARPAKFSFKQFGRPDMDNDYPLIRLGEMYLVRGEAMARAAGNWDMALNDVNTIRARAGVSNMASLDADSFLAERGREMFQEGARRTDLIRFGKYNDAWWEKSVDPSDHVNLFPIPFDQIQAATGEPLNQNPGY